MTIVMDSDVCNILLSNFCLLTFELEELLRHIDPDCNTQSDYDHQYTCISFARLEAFYSITAQY